MNDSNLIIFDTSLDYSSFYTFTFSKYFQNVTVSSIFDKSKISDPNSFLLIDYSIYRKDKLSIFNQHFPTSLIFTTFSISDFKSSFFTIPPLFLNYFLKPYDISYILDTFSFYHK